MNETFSSSEHLKIGQLAQLCGKTIRALHLYEELGLLTPTERSKGGFRLYSQDAIQRVHWISLLQEAELSLNEIREFLQYLGQESIAPSAMSRVRELFEKKLYALREQQARLKRLEKELEDGLSYLDSCKSCEPTHTAQECGDCRIHGHTDVTPILVAGLHRNLKTKKKTLVNL